MLREKEMTVEGLHQRESLSNLSRRNVNFRRPERARKEGSTGPKRLDDTQAIVLREKAMTVEGLHAAIYYRFAADDYTPAFRSVHAFTILRLVRSTAAFVAERKDVCKA
jgi:hypothetical protein